MAEEGRDHFSHGGWFIPPLTTQYKDFPLWHDHTRIHKHCADTVFFCIIWEASININTFCVGVGTLIGGEGRSIDYSPCRSKLTRFRNCQSQRRTWVRLKMEDRYFEMAIFDGVPKSQTKPHHLQMGGASLPCPLPELMPHCGGLWHSSSSLRGARSIQTTAGKEENMTCLRSLQLWLEFIDIILPSILKSLGPSNQNPGLLVRRIGSIHLNRPLQRKASRRCWKLSTRAARVLPSRCSVALIGEFRKTMDRQNMGLKIKAGGNQAGDMTIWNHMESRKEGQHHRASKNPMVCHHLPHYLTAIKGRVNSFFLGGTRYDR